AWSFKGVAEAARAEVGGYSLARLAGPVGLSRKGRTLAFSAEAKGSGGAGRGVAAALLGGSPAAQVEGSRLADGRLLLRRLDVTGPGLKVQATGDRGLLGGLNFRGQAQVSNLAAARPGASGVIDGGWSAAQSGADRPWTFTVDAKGARFASGLAELDRLLGPQPTLKAAASLDKGVVQIAQARLAGAQAKIDAAGAVGPAGKLAVKLDWSASGPFRAGPVEIAGQARGSGGITGDAAAPRADLIADFDAIDVPRVPLRKAHVTLTFERRADGSSGQATLAADSPFGPARARTAFRFPQGGVDLADLDLEAAGVKASGSLSLRSRTPSAADLRLAVGKGAFLDGGAVSGVVRIVDAPGGARGDIDLAAENAVFRGAALAIGSGRLTAQGPMSRLPYRLKVEGATRNGAWGLDGAGTLADDAPA
ncbi:MAG: translocation/assembly module TamB, partial [Dehalococcoidia bacterium]|nr:translocation/assembly module TamB [Dehalococcoidia bacterium]